MDGVVINLQTRRNLCELKNEFLLAARQAVKPKVVPLQTNLTIGTAEISICSIEIEFLGLIKTGRNVHALYTLQRTLGVNALLQLRDFVTKFSNISHFRAIYAFLDMDDMCTGNSFRIRTGNGIIPHAS